MDVQTVWQCSITQAKVSISGGQTWESTEIPGGINCTVSSADAETGWVFSLLELKATTDGGETWEKVPLPEGARAADIVAISLRAAGEGYILSSDGIVYATQNKGESWSSLPLDMEEYGEMTLLPSDLPPAAVRFFDADNGMIVLSLVGGGQKKVVALRTTDGGETWADETVFTGDVGILHLTHDGKFLTITSFLRPDQVTVLEYQGD